MRREDRFVVSRNPFAVDLSSLRVNRECERYDGSKFYDLSIRAVWFRRRGKVMAAFIGSLWDLQNTAPGTGVEFLERHNDGRYGGSAAGRWNGTGYWGSEVPEVMTQHLDVLRPMLESYQRTPRAPQVPGGYDGWWTFK